MANQACDNFVYCPPCADTNPFSNKSAESADPADFFRFVFVQELPNFNALNDWWAGTAIPAGCHAPTVQEAEDCARRLGENEIVGSWRDRLGIPSPLYGNNAVQCSIDCGEGFKPFVYTVAAGTVVARTQAQADAIAASLCQIRALENRVCVPIPQDPTIEVVDVSHINDLSENGIIAAMLNSGLPGYYYNGAVVALSTLAGTTDGEAFAVNSSFEFAVENFKPFGGGFDDGIWQTLAAQQIIGNGSSFLPSVSNAAKRINEDGKMVCVQGYYNPDTALFTAAVSFGVGIANAQVTAINTDGLNTFVAAYKNSVIVPLGVFRWIVESNTLQNIIPAAADNTGIPRAVGATSSGCILGQYTLVGVTKGFINKSGTSASSITLGNLGGNVAPNAINDSNVVCGDAVKAGQVIPFRWTESGGIDQLPMIATTISGSAKDVNTSGDIVGNMNDSFAVSFAFLYRNGVTYDLFSLVPADKKGGSQWTALATAKFVNDNKQIAGFGTYNGVTKGYLMRVP